MQVILLERVAKLGQMGDVVKVKDGYGRNFLLPRGYATRWTRGGQKTVDTIKAGRAARAVRDQSHAEEIKAKLEGSPVDLQVRAGESGRLFGAVTTAEIANALAAASMALAAGLDIEQIRAGLEAAAPVAGRGVARRLASGAELIDDSYNANPGSTHAAIDTLAAGGGEAWLVLGDMRELGEDEVALHAEAGRRAKAAGIARLYTMGPLAAHAATAFGEGAHHFDTHEALAEALAGGLREGVRVLVKGSRGSAMDRVVAALLQGEGTDAA